MFRAMDIDSTTIVLSSIVTMDSRGAKDAGRNEMTIFFGLLRYLAGHQSHVTSSFNFVAPDRVDISSWMEPLLAPVGPPKS